MFKYGAFFSVKTKEYTVSKVFFYWERNKDVSLKEAVTTVFIKVNHNTFYSPVGKGIKERYQQTWVPGKQAYK